jgi:hypothetical protein
MGIFLRGIPSTTTREELKERFGPYGSVVSITIMPSRCVCCCWCLSLGFWWGFRKGELLADRVGACRRPRCNAAAYTLGVCLRNLASCCMLVRS